MKYIFYIFLFLLIGANVYAKSKLDKNYIVEARSYIEKKTGQPATTKQTVKKLNRLATGLYRNGDYRTALTVAQQNYRYVERGFGKEHPDTLTIVNNLAFLYESLGYYGEAEPLYQRVLTAREKVLGVEHPHTLISVNNLAGLYQSQGRDDKAEPLYQRALTVSEKTLGIEDPNTLTNINNLAFLYQSQGRYGEAEPLYQQALAVREKVLGREHPDVLLSVSNLAGLYLQQGRYGEAEPLFQRVLVDREKMLGRKHPDTLTSVGNLAGLYRSQSRYGEAELLFQRAMEDREKVLGRKHPDTLLSVNNLAGLYQSQGRYDKAEPLYQRVLAVRKKVLGDEHPNTLTSANDLALLYKSQGRYSKAELLFQQVLAVKKKVLGGEHPSTLSSASNLAMLYQFQDRYAEAEPLYQRTLTVREKVLGAEHPDTLKIQLSFAVNQINLKKYSKVLTLLEQLEPRLLDLAALRLRHTQQERVRRQFLFEQSAFQDVVFTLALKQAGPRAVALATRLMLRWKQIQTEEELFMARFVRSQAGASSDAVQTLAAEITALRQDISQLTNRPGDPSESEMVLIRNRLNNLEAKEVRLAQLSREFKRHLEVRSANIADVRDNLPKKSALLELRRYWPFDFKQAKSGNPHFIALLLTTSGKMSLHDLGPVAEVRARWAELRGDYSKEKAAALYQQLFGSLHKRLNQFETLYIAPDHMLTQVAFARLVTPDGKYWLEGKTALRQLRTGRHLIAGYENDLIRPKGLLAIGNVPYDEYAPSPKKRSAPKLENPLQLAANETRAAARALRNARGKFLPLTQTGPEVRAIANRYWDDEQTKSRLWLGSMATEHNLKTLDRPPRVIHFATHGFYLPNDSSAINRPMVLSGLALAGANRGRHGETGPDGEDGILYALEAQDLNLRGTELVVLSACDTGTGTLDYSEGVYGLQRAFRIAGARNILMSLWSLGDESARVFMERFYLNWLDGSKPKALATALRETQLSFINDKDSRLRDPQAWAPYVLVEGG